MYRRINRYPYYCSNISSLRVFQLFLIRFDLIFSLFRLKWFPIGNIPWSICPNILLAIFYSKLISREKITIFIHRRTDSFPIICAKKVYGCLFLNEIDGTAWIFFPQNVVSCSIIKIIKNLTSMYAWSFLKTHSKQN